MAGFGTQFGAHFGGSPSGVGFGVDPFGSSPFGTGVSVSDQVVSPVGIVSAEAFGVPVVMFGPIPVLFPAGREGFLDGTVSWVAPTIQAALIRGYTVSPAHTFVSDVTAAGGSVVATTTLVNKTAVAGIADASDITFPAVAAGAALSTVIVFQSSAVTGGADVVPSAQRLIGYIELPAGAGSVVPTGVDIAVSWSNGRSRIFML